MINNVKEDSLYYDLLGQVIRQARIDYLRHVAMFNGKIKIPNKANQFQHEIAGKDAEDFFFRTNRLEDFLSKFQIDFIEPSFLRSQILNDVDLILEEKSPYKIMRIIANTHELKRIKSRQETLLN